LRVQYGGLYGRCGEEQRRCHLAELAEGSQITAAVGDAVIRLRLKPLVSLFISAK